jgi:N-acetylglucosaminyl-diphospho-decaprenol L-rhamnosyltransferase
MASGPSALQAPPLAMAAVASRRRRLVRSSLQSPRLSVIIVNYRLWEETGKLVRELAASPCTRNGEAEVVVVDNHSPLHPLARRLRRWSGVSLRRWGKNRGFAWAVNEGSRLCRGDWLLLLNPDISVSRPFLEQVLRLIGRLEGGPARAGIVGFQLRNTDGTPQLSFGPFPTLWQTLLRLALPRTRRKYHFVHCWRRRRVSWVTGCCLLVRRDCLEQIGGLDRDFFLYYEDVDLCRRAHQKGWSVWFEPSLQVRHHRPLHARPVSAYLRCLTRHALLTYASKHWPEWQFRLLAGVVEVEARLRKQWARYQEDSDTARTFGCLRRMAANLRRGRRQRAHRYLQQLVQREERHLHQLGQREDRAYAS